jgi:hypothetical protein
MDPGASSSNAWAADVQPGTDAKDPDGQDPPSEVIGSATITQEAASLEHVQGQVDSSPPRRRRHRAPRARRARPAAANEDTQVTSTDSHGGAAEQNWAYRYRLLRDALDSADGGD